MGQPSYMIYWFFKTIFNIALQILINDTLTKIIKTPKPNQLYKGSNAASIREMIFFEQRKDSQLE